MFYYLVNLAKVKKNCGQQRNEDEKVAEKREELIEKHFVRN